MINKRQFFRHTFKCPECKELTTRTSKYEVVNLAFPYVTCGYCLVIMPSTCAINSDLATEQSGDNELLCVSIIYSALLSGGMKSELSREQAILHLRDLQSRLTVKENDT